MKEDEKGYPQPTVWGNLPSYGLFIRNVRSIAVDNATFQSEKPDPRIPVIAVNVGNLSLDGYKSTTFLPPVYFWIMSGRRM